MNDYPIFTYLNNYKLQTFCSIHENYKEKILKRMEMMI